MNHDNDGPARDGDPLVSAAYRELANERAPAALDKAILAKAATAAGGGRTVQRFSAWFRPLAFIATASLSLAIILEFRQADNVPVPRIPAANETGGIAPREDRPRAEVPDTPSEEHVSAIRTDSFERAENQTAPPVGSDSTATDTRPSPLEEASEASDLPSAAAAAGGRLQQVDRQAQPVLSGDRPERRCSVEESRSADAWWTCIEKLRRDGEADAANTELALMQSVFPDYTPPE